MKLNIILSRQSMPHLFLMRSWILRGFLSSVVPTAVSLCSVLIRITFLLFLGTCDITVCVSVKANFDESASLPLVDTSAGGSSGLFFLTVPSMLSFLSSSSWPRAWSFTVFQMPIYSKMSKEAAADELQKFFTKFNPEMIHSFIVNRQTEPRMKGKALSD